MHKILLDIIKRYNDKIKEHGLTKREFCRLAGVHENTLYNMKNPRINTLQKMETAIEKLELGK